MDGPTLTPKYNALIEFWNSAGAPIPPECEACGKDVSGMKVVEASVGFICEQCDPDPPRIWPSKEIFHESPPRKSERIHHHRTRNG